MSEKLLLELLVELEVTWEVTGGGVALKSLGSGYRLVLYLPFPKLTGVGIPLLQLLEQVCERLWFL